MSEKSADDAVQYTRFRKSVNLVVDKAAWEATCDELQKKSVIGIFIFIGFSILVSIFTFGILVFLAAMGLGIFLNIGVRRRFSHLRSLADQSFTMSGTQITTVQEGKKQIVPFDKIKNIEIHNWGVELDTKKKRKMSDKGNEGKILIPKSVNDYGRVLATVKALKAS